MLRSFFQPALLATGTLNNDPSVWIDEARPTPKYVWKTPNEHGAFNNNNYISKYIKICKIGVMLRSFFWPASLARELSITILLFL
jgi:hypothetical protein